MGTDGMGTGVMGTDGMGTGGMGTGDMGTDGMCTDGMGTGGMDTDGMGMGGMGMGGIGAGGMGTGGMGTACYVMVTVIQYPTMGITYVTVAKVTKLRSTIQFTSQSNLSEAMTILSMKLLTSSGPSIDPCDTLQCRVLNEYYVTLLLTFR